jgi:tRNA (guanine-N7-)-methyltransferase
MSPSNPQHSRIRSFVRRAGRMTIAQSRALDRLWPKYGLATDACLALDQCFNRSARRVLEIGFGNGDVIAELAAEHPEFDYLGLEVHEPGIGHLLLLLEANQLTNVRLLNGDAAELLPRCIPAESLAAINIFFPDPWHKKRHHKRRLIQPTFVANLARCLPVQGALHLATDWPDYAEQMRLTLNNSGSFAPIAATELGSDPIWERRPTKFERRGERLGHPVTDLYYQRSAVAPQILGVARTR